jgi:hypothetical protein
MMVHRNGNLVPASHTELRDAERVNVTALIKVRQRGARGIRVVVEDISRTGCRVQWPHNAIVGDRVWISFPGLEAISALIVWTAEFRFGCRFEVPLYSAVFRMLVLQRDQ